METNFSEKEKNKIKKSIQKKYKKVARSPVGLFKYPTGRAGLEALQYGSEFIQVLPDSVAASYCGVGNPFTLGPINKGETVLDIGCGAGVDSFIAAMTTGSTGTVVGVDLISGMLNRANENLTLIDLQNVSFQEASAENLPFADEDFDVVTSNGALNLVPDKARAFAEIYRVLKPGGRLMVADEILIGELPKEKDKIIKSWAQ